VLATASQRRDQKLSLWLSDTAMRVGLAGVRPARGESFIATDMAATGASLVSSWGNVAPSESSILIRGPWPSCGLFRGEAIAVPAFPSCSASRTEYSDAGHGDVHAIEVRESEFTWRLCRSEQRSPSAAGCKCRARWTSFEYRRDLAPSEPANRRCSAMRPATCR
jgi:hypothetical protein